MEKESIYYRGKLLNLFNKIFVEIGDVRSRFINCEKQFSVAYDASMYDGVPLEIKEYWKMMWNDLNTKEELIMDKGTLTYSSFHQTIKSKKNKTLEKYLHFLLEESSRLKEFQNGNI
ncbi:hypothetical protein LNJ05_12300 [Tenacibaculum finnmarkense genomovar ulcerans]|uniref:hypothetical protein n=1 Tax=Tenacibaculum finnmarkense TaxID=2781243 RepID=UPI001E642AC3|nr:hypothetical protein [Tenacibaculum finnmarkense]MCD8433543.1 hypothetical protein [Tenacibaculum finnmarkense genomovar ulcerans]